MNKTKIKDRYLNCNKLLIKFIYNNHLLYPLLMVLSFAFSIIILLNKTTAINLNDYTYNFLVILMSVFIINLILLNIILKENKIEHIYLSLIIPIGFMYMTFLLPNFGYDESAHAYRTFVISEGYLVTDINDDHSVKMMVPKSLLDIRNKVTTYQTYVDYFEHETDYSDLVEVYSDGTGAAPYVFLAYLFPAIGMKIGNILNLNILISYYLARLFGFLFSIFVIYYALKLIPFGKILMLVFVFNPMFIQPMVSLSADSVINTLTVFFISFILCKCYKKEKMLRIDYLILFFISLFLALAKYAYLPLTFLLLLLWSKGNSKNNKILLAIIIISILSSLSLYLFTTKYYTLKISYIAGKEFNSIEQIKFILKNPINYIKILIDTTINKFDFYFFTLFGRNLGPYTINIAETIPITYFCLLLFSPFLEKNNYELRKSHLVIFMMIALMSYTLIQTGLYIGWTSVGAGIVEGVHGRYFVPILIIIMFLLIRKKNEIKINNKMLYIVLLIAIINLSCCDKISIFFNY